MKIGFIGAGRTGVSLGKYIKETGLKNGGYYSRTGESVRWAAEFTQSNVSGNIKEIISIFSNTDSAKYSVFSVHPLCAISSREHTWENLSLALFTIEGEFIHYPQNRSS